MRPNERLFSIVKAMLFDAWDQRTAQANEIRKALRRDILKLEKQIDGFLDRLVDSTNAGTIRAYENKINQLERNKLVASEKLEKSLTPKATAQGMLELSMRFLANPCKIWESGNITLQKMVLRLAFAAPLPYHRNEGYRTPKTTLPFSMLGGFQTSKCKMVPPAGIEPALQYRNRILNPARLPVPPEGPKFQIRTGMLGEYSIAAGQVNQEDHQISFFGQARMIELDNQHSDSYIKRVELRIFKEMMYKPHTAKIDFYYMNIAAFVFLVQLRHIFFWAIWEQGLNTFC